MPFGEMVLLNRCKREGLQGLWERVAWWAWRRTSAIVLRAGLFGSVGIGLRVRRDEGEREI